MKLVLYSGGKQQSNHVLHRELVALAGLKSKKKLTYLAYCTDYAHLFYQRIVRRYRSHGVSDFQILILDQNYTSSEIKKALQTDIVYISGGNTFYMLHHMKRLKLINPLQKYAKKGGVLAGLSAGALILSPHIQLAGYPAFVADENEVGLKNLKSLGLVNFEFYPHYSNSKKLNDALINYSTKSKKPIYACEDGSGIVIKNKEILLKGEVTVFHQGFKFSL